MKVNIKKVRKFVSPEIIMGNGTRLFVGQYCENYAVKKVMIVTDQGVIDAGWVKDVQRSLDEKNIEYIIYSDVSPNPRSEEVMRGVDLYKTEGCRALVSVGGGSPMDCAKAIGIVINNDKHILLFEGIDKIPIPVPPLIFVPTTAGTSSEVSQFTIIKNESEMLKIAIISKSIVPDVAIIDSEVTVSMDNYLTACTGLDALTHAFEAFVSTGSSAMTDLHALEAVRLVTTYLPKVLKDSGNIEFREKVMLGSLQAGLAFSNAILGAVHAMAHSLGGYLDLPHGECNALLLDHVVRYNYSEAADRYQQLAEAAGVKVAGMDTKTVGKALVEKIVNLKHGVGIDKTLKLVGVKTSDIPVLAKKAIKDACIVTNPRKATEKDLEVIYEEAL
jgi:alcohol dehydrogenase class IV